MRTNERDSREFKQRKRELVQLGDERLGEKESIGIEDERLHHSLTQVRNAISSYIPQVAEEMRPAVESLFGVIDDLFARENECRMIWSSVEEQRGKIRDARQDMLDAQLKRVDAGARTSEVAPIMTTGQLEADLNVLQQHVDPYYEKFVQLIEVGKSELKRLREGPPHRFDDQGSAWWNERLDWLERYLSDRDAWYSSLEAYYFAVNAFDERWAQLRRDVEAWEPRERPALTS